MNIEDIMKQCKTPLNYEGFEKYRIKNNHIKEYGWKENQQWLFKFENNYGASVIKHYGSYGWEEDLFELAVIYFDEDSWQLTYNTPITNDVIGHLTNNDVIRYLNKIKRLEEKK